MFEDVRRAVLDGLRWALLDTSDLVWPDPRKTQQTLLAEMEEKKKAKKVMQRERLTKSLQDIVMKWNMSVGKLMKMADGMTS